MSKYKILKDNLKNVVGEEFERTLPIIAEEYEAKIRRQAAEITRLLAENKRLKAENGNVIWEIEQAFDRGCNEAWELAREILFEAKQGGMEDEKYKAIFGSGNPSAYVIKNHTYSEAAAKVVEWEKAKDEIKVGDVLEDMASSKIKCVVTNIYPSNMAYLVFSDGSAGIHELENMKKTGRHIDIDGFLKQIGEE